MEILENNYSSSLDKINNIVQLYIKSYIDFDYHNTYKLIENIQQNIFDLNYEKRITNFIFYINLLIQNKNYINAVTDFKKSTSICEEKLHNLKIHLLEKNNKSLFLDLLSFSPDQLLLLILYYTLDEIKEIKEDPKNFNPLVFSYNLIKDPNRETKYFYFDTNYSCLYCEYLGRIISINNSKHDGTHDYHLPIFWIIFKYTEYNICLTNDFNIIAENHYYYVHTVKHLYNFLSNNKKDFLRTVPKKILEDINRNKAIYILNSSQEGLFLSDFYSDILKSIKKNINYNYRKNVFILNGNNFDNITLNRFNKSLPIISDNIWSIIKNLLIKPRCFDKTVLNILAYRYFESAIAIQNERHYSHYKFEDKLNALKSNNFKHFLCYNRHKKDFRYAFIFLLWKNKLLENTICSLQKLDSLDELSKPIDKNIKTKIIEEDKNAFIRFLDYTPLTADKENQKLNYWHQITLSQINNAFLWLVTETSFERYNSIRSSFITEKTYKPISLYMPFIVIGDRHTLHNLHKDGYKTFSSWWDESYDDIFDKVERLKKILSLLLWINDLKKNTLIEIYKEMEEILKHNKKILESSTSTLKTSQLLTNINLE